MKRFLILFSALFIMQTFFLIANEDIVWTKQTHDVKFVQFSPDGTMIATNNDGQVLIHDVETKETLHEYNPILQTRFTPDGKYIVGYFNTGHPIIIDIATWTKKENIQAAPSGILFFDISSDGKKIIASYSRKYGYSIWDIESGQIERTVQFPIEDSVNVLWAEINNIHFGKDDKTIIYTVTRTYPTPKPTEFSYKVSTHIIDAETFEEKFKINKGGMLNLSNNKNIIADRGIDKGVAFRVVGINNWDIFFSIPGDWQFGFPNIGALVFSPDDKYLIAGSGLFGNRIAIYEIPSGKESYTYNLGTLDNVDASKDGRYIIASNGERLYLLNTRYGSTSVKEPESITGFLTYPNPTNSNSVTIEFNLINSGVIKIELFDFTGKIVKIIKNTFLEAGNHKYEINLSRLISGHYNLTIVTVSGTTNHKIIVNR